ncbi:MAG: hypothetical protein AAGB48_08285 [Planctomycetota bacterium]
MASQGPPPADPSAGSTPVGRPYLRIYFECANQYVRVYRRPDQRSYIARCPACGQTKNFRVGRDGSDQRFFTLTCR